MRIPAPPCRRTFVRAALALNWAQLVLAFRWLGPMQKPLHAALACFCRATSHMSWWPVSSALGTLMHPPARPPVACTRQRSFIVQISRTALRCDKLHRGCRRLARN